MFAIRKFHYFLIKKATNYSDMHTNIKLIFKNRLNIAIKKKLAIKIALEKQNREALLRSAVCL